MSAPRGRVFRYAGRWVAQVRTAHGGWDDVHMRTYPTHGQAIEWCTRMVRILR